MWQYHFTSEIYHGELYHHGVKGMKWGVRKAQKLVGKADRARAAYAKYDEKARALQAQGKTRRAQKYADKASEYGETASRFQAKADKKAERRYAKAGKAEGKAEYYKEQGKKAYKDYNERATALEKQAKYEDSHGKSLTALRLRETAKGIRAEGKSAMQESMAIADRYVKKSNSLKEKANTFSTTTRINLGKSRIDSIMKSAKSKGYNSAKFLNDIDDDGDSNRYDRDYAIAKLRY